MQESFNPNSLLLAAKNQISADLSSGDSASIIILGLKDGVYYELKEVSARVWELIQEPCSFKNILETLLDEYEVDSDQCESDLLVLIENLAKYGLIETEKT